jgi:hypothetical protein
MTQKKEMSQAEIKLAIGDTLDGRYRIVADGVAQDIGTRYSAYDLQGNWLVDLLLLARRFGTGVALLARLTDANQAVADLARAELVPFDHAGLVEGQLYLVRRRLEGQTLSELLAKIGFLDTAAAVSIASQACNALAPAHRAGLVHGGLSPHSVFIGADGRVLITDFGLMPALQPVPAPQGRPWGRFPYTSPEQAAGEEAHPATDVYLVGSLLYEMLTGRTVFVAADETGLALQHLRQDPVPLQARIPQVPPALAQIVHKALAKEPAMRYRNAGQLSHILHSHLAPGSALGTPPRSELATEHLTVPAPPLRPVVRPRQGADHTTATSSRADYFELQGTYLPDSDTGEWTEEPVRVSWPMIGLIVAALIAMLGLIPLWRTVYRRYVVPPAVPTPIIYRGLDQDYATLIESQCTHAPWGTTRDANATPARRALLCQRGTLAPSRLRSFESFVSFVVRSFPVQGTGGGNI